MPELTKRLETLESKPPVSENFKDIKPQKGMTPDAARDYWDKENPFQSNGPALKSRIEPVDGHYVSYEERLKPVPIDNPGRGIWTGDPGESKYIPSDETERGKAAKEKLAEAGLDGITYANAEPDFSECAEATVEIDEMTENRLDYVDADGNEKQGNFSQADIKCAEQWNANQRDGRSDWTATEVRDWRRDNKYSWHERCDTRTMDLVSYDIHSYFRHSGGCAECSAWNHSKLTSGGVFDD